MPAGLWRTTPSRFDIDCLPDVTVTDSAMIHDGEAIELASDQVRHLPVCGPGSAQCAMSVLLRCSKISAATLPMLVKQDKSMPVTPSKPGIPSL